MILYIRRNGEGINFEHVVRGEAKCIESIFVGSTCVQISGTGTKADCAPNRKGWHYIWVMDLETGEYIGNNETIKPAPWVHDPLLRALKVVEFLEKERKEQ